MNKDQIIANTVEFVKKTLVDAEGGHDWFHINRVWNMSKRIAKEEDVDSFIVELGALLHDIADAKFHNGDEEVGPRVSKEFLKTQGVTDGVIQHVENVIRHISFKSNIDGQKFKSPELDVIQDADRIDALGAIGIARAFNFGGFKNRTLWDPSIEPVLNMSKEEYKKSAAPTVNHFYEKLLLLKDKMNTETGKKIAQGRHDYMVAYLDQFFSEWKGEY